MNITIKVPDNLSENTIWLVRDTAEKMALKLKKSEIKYGYSDEWTKPGWENECRQSLMEHLEKGDPTDVINFCAFMLYHGWSTK